MTNLLFRRFCAFLIDTLLIVLAAFIFNSVVFAVIAGGAALSSVLTLAPWRVSQMTFTLIDSSPVWIFFFYHALFVLLFGTTPGKKLLGLKIVSVDTRTKPNAARIFLREILGNALNLLSLNTGALVALFDPRGQGWHDKLSKTLVVPSRDPEMATCVPSAHQTLRHTLAFAILGTLNAFILLNIATNVATNARTQARAQCGFPEASATKTTTTHFDIAMEQGTHREDMATLRADAEHAFDYSFWNASLSPTFNVSARTKLCLYQNQKNYERAYRENFGTGLQTPYAFFSGTFRTIHFSPAFLTSTQAEQQQTVSHEINHYVLDNLRNTQGYPYEFPDWLTEGIAELSEQNYIDTPTDIQAAKASVRNDNRPWKDMASNPRELDLSFYNQSYLMVRFLQTYYLEYYGSNDFLKQMLHTAIDNVMPINQAIEKTTGKSMGELERLWNIWLAS